MEIEWKTDESTITIIVNRNPWETFSHGNFVRCMCVRACVKSRVQSWRFPYGRVRLLMNALIILLHVWSKRDGKSERTGRWCVHVNSHGPKWCAHMCIFLVQWCYALNEPTHVEKDLIKMREAMMASIFFSQFLFFLFSFNFNLRSITNDCIGFSMHERMRNRRWESRFFFILIICVRCLLFKNRNENLEKISKFSHGLKIAEQIVHIARSIPFSKSSFVCNV